MLPDTAWPSENKSKMNEEVREIRDRALEELASLKNQDSQKKLQDLRVKYLGKKGFLTILLKSLGKLPIEDRPATGKIINEAKAQIETAIEDISRSLKASEEKRSIESRRIDVTLPGFFVPQGRQHPINQVLDEICEVFISMGFRIEEGPEVEDDYHNFEALNIPSEHPARDMQDTFYVAGGGMVLRTHTSPVQVRVMERERPPIRIIAPGKVYRCDSDQTHTPMFHQIEGLLVDRNISMADLKGILETFVHAIFGPKTPVRLRPSYFPFTEPSAEIDIGCVICGGPGCGVCKKTGWIEILGAGMVNPRVFEFSDYDPEEYTGFAFGLGIERVAMLKYGIDDLRLFFENDIRFLEQF